MDGSRNYQIVPLKRFETSYVSFVKKYYKKDKKSKNNFLVVINGFLRQLEVDPNSNYLDCLGKKVPSSDESFPKGVTQEIFKFRKIRFSTPGLTKQALFGRFMYVIYEKEKIVFPLWVYTHAEHPKRPHERELHQEFALIKNYIEDSFGDN